MGVIYGEQPAGKDWKDSLKHKMVMKGGFREVMNMENMYYHPLWKVVVSVHVDDPLIVAIDEDGHELTHDFLDDQFDTKGRNRLTHDKQIDYLSMEISLSADNDIIITNRAKCEKMLADAGMSECLPTTQPPMTKQSLKQALENSEPLSDEENTARLGDNGRFGWLAQTTHLGLAVSTSIAQGLPPVQGTKDVSAMMYQWVQAHKGDGLISKSGDMSGFSISTDADWAGMHSVTGEVRSRTGVMICYNGMPILWYTGLQKTIASQWTNEDEAIATSSGNAETLAASETLVRALSCTYVADEVGIEVPRPILIEIDANAALGFLNNSGSPSRMKHIDIRKGWIQQLRDRTIAEFVKVDGTIIKANFMTKLLNRVEFDQEYKRLAFIPETLETPPNDAEEDHERSATSDEV
jgi:hypothetical protein